MITSRTTHVPTQAFFLPLITTRALAQYTDLTASSSGRQLDNDTLSSYVLGFIKRAGATARPSSLL